MSAANDPVAAVVRDKVRTLDRDIASYQQEIDGANANLSYLSQQHEGLLDERDALLAFLAEREAAA